MLHDPFIAFRHFIREYSVVAGFRRLFMGCCSVSHLHFPPRFYLWILLGTKFIGCFVFFSIVESSRILVYFWFCCLLLFYLCLCSVHVHSKLRVVNGRKTKVQFCIALVKCLSFLLLSIRLITCANLSIWHCFRIRNSYQSICDLIFFFL